MLQSHYALSINQAQKVTQKYFQIKKITSKNAPTPIGPYSHAVLTNGFLFVSGQIGKNAENGELVLSDIKSETKQVMENIGAILKEAEMDFNNIVKATIFLADMNNFSQVNEVYGSYFNSPLSNGEGQGVRYFPARETVQVSKLPLNVNVEISVVAAK